MIGDVDVNVPRAHRGGGGTAIPQLFVILGEFAACHCRTRGTVRTQ
jgi:hypothetical protein